LRRIWRCERARRNFWENNDADAKGAIKWLDEEYAEYKAILTELGAAK
jgi:hypothetical protein